MAIRILRCDFRRIGLPVGSAALGLALVAAGPQSESPTVTAEIGVRARVVENGANPILPESTNSIYSNDLQDLFRRAERGLDAAAEFEFDGALVRVDARPEVEEPLQLLVEYVGN